MLWLKRYDPGIDQLLDVCSVLSMAVSPIKFIEVVDTFCLFDASPYTSYSEGNIAL